MKLSPEEFDRIERYILNEMSAEELDAFEANIKNDISLEEKVRQVRLLLLGVQEAKLSIKLEEFHSGLHVQQSKEGKQKIIRFKSWLIAAAVIVVIGIGTWLLLNRFNGNEQLYSNYYKPDPGLITAMSTSDNYDFDRAMIDYKTGNYTAAVNAWNIMLAAKPANDTLNYFVGSSYLALEENTKAIEHLKKVTQNNQSNFQKDAFWYLGLAYLQEGKKQEAISFIQKSDHQNKEALLRKLQ